MNLNFRISDNRIEGNIDSKEFSITYDEGVRLEANEIIICYTGDLPTDSEIKELVESCKKALTSILIQGHIKLGFTYDEFSVFLRSVSKISPSLAYIVRYEKEGSSK